MNNNTQLGLTTELLCQLDFSQRNILLSQPITNDSRYDFIADIDGELIKIQCKTAKPKNNDIITISSASKNWNSGEIHNYIGQIDYFYTNYNNQGYLLPIDLFSEKNREKSIRLGSVEQYNSNNDTATYGEKYKIDNVLKRDFAKFDYNIIKIEDGECHNRMGRKLTNYFCKNCGDKISSRNGFCVKCSSIKRRTVERPNREELKNMIETTPFTTIAKKYGVTDNAVRKWCDSMNLPRKKSIINS